MLYTPLPPFCNSDAQAPFPVIRHLEFVVTQESTSHMTLVSQLAACGSCTYKGPVPGGRTN